MLATHQTLRSKTPHSPHPPALTVSLLECTKDRANGDGTESQILLNCQEDPSPNPPGQAFPGAADWDVLRETVLVLQITQERNQPYGPRQKSLVNCLMCEAFPDLQVWKKSWEWTESISLPLKKTAIALFFAREIQSRKLTLKTCLNKVCIYKQVNLRAFQHL